MGIIINTDESWMSSFIFNDLNLLKQCVDEVSKN